MPLSDWQTSLERLDPDKDYVLNNVALDACEFNTSCQWSLEKILQIPLLIHKPSDITLNDLNAAQSPLRREHRTRMQALIFNNSHYCYGCGQWKPSYDFFSSRRTLCKSCYGPRVYKYRNTLRGFIKNSLSYAKRRSKLRLSKGSDTRNDFNLTFDDVSDMLEKQMFRCSYSGIPMTLKTNADWKCSLERIDNFEGYTKENCVLICWEFNSSDQTLDARNPVFGSSQWSKEKFNYFYRIRFGMEPQTKFGY
eukprot:907255_1